MIHKGLKQVSHRGTAEKGERKMEDKLKLTVSEVLYQKYPQESDNFLFCRVPKSEGKRFIRFAVDSMKPNVSNNGMIVSIDPLKEYTLLDKGGTQVEKIQGVDLYNSYYEYLPFLDGERKNADKKTLEEESRIAEENKKVIARITEQQKKAREAVKENQNQQQKTGAEKVSVESTTAQKEDVQKVYTQEQFREIRKGIRNGVDVSKYKAIHFNHLQMKEIRLGLESGIDVNLYNNSQFNAAKMKEMRLGLSQGFDMKKYHGFNGEQLRQIRLGLDKNLDVTKYTNRKLNPEQMKLIRTGMQAGLDVTLFNNDCFDISMMKKIHTDLMVRKIINIVKDMFVRIKESIANLIDEVKVSNARRAALMNEIDEAVDRELGNTAKIITDLMTEAEMVSEEQSEEVTATVKENLETEYEKATDEKTPISKEEVVALIETMSREMVKEILAKVQMEEAASDKEQLKESEEQEVQEKIDLPMESQENVCSAEEVLAEIEEIEEYERGKMPERIIEHDYVNRETQHEQMENELGEGKEDYKDISDLTPIEEVNLNEIDVFGEEDLSMQM